MYYQVNANGFRPAYYSDATNAYLLAGKLADLKIPHSVRIVTKAKRLANLLREE